MNVFDNFAATNVTDDIQIINSTLLKDKCAQETILFVVIEVDCVGSSRHKIVDFEGSRMQTQGSRGCFSFARRISGCIYAFLVCERAFQNRKRVPCPSALPHHQRQHTSGYNIQTSRNAVPFLSVQCPRRTKSPPTDYFYPTGGRPSRR